MLVTRSGLQESSVMVALSSDSREKPSGNQEYIVVYSDDGTITLVPKTEDLFSSGGEAGYYERDE